RPTRTALRPPKCSPCGSWACGQTNAGVELARSQDDRVRQEVDGAEVGDGRRRSELGWEGGAWRPREELSNPVPLLDASRFRDDFWARRGHPRLMLFDHFDLIRIVNLPHRKDRRAEMCGQLAKLGLLNDPRVAFFDALSFED